MQDVQGHEKPRIGPPLMNEHAQMEAMEADGVVSCGQFSEDVVDRRNE